MDQTRGFPTLLLALTVATVLWVSPVQAQFARPDPSAKYLVTADALDYDQEAQTVTASGNAEISDAQNMLGASSLFYDEKNDMVMAGGKVWILQPDGSAMFANNATFSSNFDQGFASDVGMRMVDNSLLAARQMRRINGRYTLFDKGVFSPCLLCPEDPRKAPLWQLKAERVTHDQEKHDLIYRNATLDMWGVPVFYTPYFSNPDPTVKRRSGFLTPTIGRSSNLGAFTTVPYYYTFSPDFDITFRPTISKRDGVRWEDTLRKRFEHGEIQATTSLVITDRTDDDGTTKKDQLRGHAVGFIRFDLDPVFRAGSEFALQTDKSYSLRYNNPLADILTNRVYLEGLKGRQFGALEFFYFQNNRPGPQPEAPLVLPRMRFSALGEPNRTLGGRWSFDGIATALSRDSGADNRKLGVDFGWERREVLPGGFALALTGHVRDDIFWVDDFPNINAPGQTLDNNITNRLFPIGQAALRYPLVNHYDTFSHIVEPILSFTASRTMDRDRHIPNEDSVDVEFDATNLFDLNRYPGTDAEEQGLRMAYGLRNAFNFDSGGTGEVLIGQNYRITDDPLFPTGSGLDTRFSDYVGEILLDPGPWLHFDYLFRLDKDGLNSRKHDVKTDFGVPEFRPHIEYTYIDQPTVAPGAIGKVEEIKYGFSSNFTKYWTLIADQTRDLRTRGGAALRTNVGLIYQDECFTGAITWSRDFTERADVRSGDTVFFRIFFKHLGGIDSGGSENTSP